ncbi:MAG: hypothetical protein CMB73_02990 [Euryarchaeota archaeon]|nr:hypothetical protein [Euryarchaeota archaeon]|tara:strand:+ start:2289 stop:2669 length:381 start_codon:yes stop_codon:yes gene_type:complete
MAQKKLEPESEYNKYDIDGDGIVTDEELDMDERMLRLQDMKSDMENEDKKQDAQRNMAWFALFGMLLYPALVVFSIWYELAQAAEVLGDMAPTYFVSVAAIVAAFYGKEALSARKGDSVKVSQSKR